MLYSMSNFVVYTIVGICKDMRNTRYILRTSSNDSLRVVGNVRTGGKHTHTHTHTLCNAIERQKKFKKDSVAHEGWSTQPRANTFCFQKECDKFQYNLSQ